MKRRSFLAGLAAAIAAPAIPAADPLYGTSPMLAAMRAELIVSQFGIEDQFLANLFKVLSDHPGLTATQIIDLANEKGLLAA